LPVQKIADDCGFMKGEATEIRHDALFRMCPFSYLTPVGEWAILAKEEGSP